MRSTVVAFLNAFTLDKKDDEDPRTLPYAQDCILAAEAVVGALRSLREKHMDSMRVERLQAVFVTAGGQLEAYLERTVSPFQRPCPPPGHRSGEDDPLGFRPDAKHGGRTSSSWHDGDSRGTREAEERRRRGERAAPSHHVVSSTYQRSPRKTRWRVAVGMPGSSVRVPANE